MTEDEIDNKSAESYNLQQFLYFLINPKIESTNIQNKILHSIKNAE